MELIVLLILTILVLLIDFLIIYFMFRRPKTTA